MVAPVHCRATTGVTTSPPPWPAVATPPVSAAARVVEGMQRTAALTAALLSLTLAAPAAADYADDCEPLGAQVQSTACHGADVVSRDVAAAGADHGPAVEAHLASWTHRALAFQYSVGNSVPLRNAQWLGTHNSFNSIEEMGPALAPMDSNQQLSLVQQLDVDVRSLELDLHTFPSARGGGVVPVVCHAQGGAGCSVEKPLDDTLAPIAAWLDAHPREVLFLYLENQLRGEGSNNDAARMIDETIGHLVYRPSGPAGQCVDVPYDKARQDVLDSGKQVVIVSNCGAGAAWRSWSFGWPQHKEARPQNWACNRDWGRATYDSTIIRYFEDDTWLTSATSNTGATSRDDGLKPATVAAMVRCGVDLFGFDQLTANDDRHDAFVWSWAEGSEPSSRCGAQRPSDGRWVARPCGERRRFVCRSSGGSFALSGKRLRGDKPPAGCGAPRTGRENEQARTAASGAEVWVWGARRR